MEKLLAALVPKDEDGSLNWIKLLIPFNKDQCKNMLDYIEFHDGHRKLNWRETFPEIVQYFE